MERILQGEFPYLVYTPKDIPTEGLPLIVFLHGAGERGNGESLDCLTVHSLPALIERGAAPRAVVVCPQCPLDTFWVADLPRLFRFIDEVEARYGTDPARVSLTGVSMGGFGTWYAALARPERFCAIAPVCGGGMPWAAKRLTMPVRAFHGDADTAVLPSCSIDMVDALHKAGHKDARLTIYHNVGHNSWDYAYDEALLSFLVGE